MDVFSETVSQAMRALVAACQTPVIVLLLAGAALAVICLGSLLAEYFTEHRRFKVFLPRLLDELKAAGPEGIAEVVKASGLLLRQKRYLVELTLHPHLSAALRESLAAGLEKQERRRYELIVKFTDLGARIAPMLGLLGTLIPLGPGIVALSAGDTATLSASLTTAFDTTSLGLMEAAVFMLVSALRSRWYKDYMSSFDTAMESIVDILDAGRPLAEVEERCDRDSATVGLDLAGQGDGAGRDGGIAGAKGGGR